MSKNTNGQLAKLRKKIDRADKDLLKAFAKRFSAVEKVGKLKKSMGLPIVQKGRWKELLNDRLAQANKQGLSEKFIKTVFDAIHVEAIRIQKRRK